MAAPSRPRRRLALLRVILVAELVVAMVTAAGVVFAYQHVDRQIAAGPKIHHHVHRPKPALPKGATNILVMGTDTRSCKGCHIDKEKGVGGSDTTILLHVENGRHAAYGISIPRDTLVDRPRCTSGGHHVPPAQGVMWNQAFALGGPECTVEQVEAVTGVYVDSYITVDFGGFKSMVDAIHGVQVCIPKPVDDPIAHIHFDPGTQTLDGAEALKYVRERHSTANSDYGRMKRQQAFIASMLNKVKSAGTLSRPDRLFEFANALAGSIQASPDLASASKLFQLASSMRGIDLKKVKFVTAPTSEFPVGSPNWGRLRLTSEAKALWHRVIEDEPLGKFGKDAITAKHPHGDKAIAAENGLCG